MQPLEFVYEPSLEEQETEAIIAYCENLDFLALQENLDSKTEWN
jgi:hypothetical protein